jgi:hypothetical protein
MSTPHWSSDRSSRLGRASPGRQWAALGPPLDLALRTMSYPQTSQNASALLTAEWHSGHSCLGRPNHDRIPDQLIAISDFSRRHRCPSACVGPTIARVGWVPGCATPNAGRGGPDPRARRQKYRTPPAARLDPRTGSGRSPRPAAVQLRQGRRSASRLSVATPTRRPTRRGPRRSRTTKPQGAPNSTGRAVPGLTPVGRTSRSSAGPHPRHHRSRSRTPRRRTRSYAGTPLGRCPSQIRAVPSARGPRRSPLHTRCADLVSNCRSGAARLLASGRALRVPACHVTREARSATTRSPGNSPSSRASLRCWGRSDDGPLWALVALDGLNVDATTSSCDCGPSATAERDLTSSSQSARVRQHLGALAVQRDGTQSECGLHGSHLPSPLDSALRCRGWIGLP